LIGCIGAERCRGDHCPERRLHSRCSITEHGKNFDGQEPIVRSCPAQFCAQAEATENLPQSDLRGMSFVRVHGPIDHAYNYVLKRIEPQIWAHQMKNFLNDLMMLWQDHPVTNCI
jgi:hypothetical protein